MAMDMDKLGIKYLCPVVGKQPPDYSMGTQNSLAFSLKIMSKVSLKLRQKIFGLVMGRYLPRPASRPYSAGKQLLLKKLT